MKGTYDSSIDAAYIYLGDVIPPGGVAKTIPVDPLAIRGQINLDFDRNGRLVGIEVLGASKRLRTEILEQLTTV